MMNNKNALQFCFAIIIMTLASLLPMHTQALPQTANVPGGVAIIKLDAPNNIEPTAHFNKHALAVVKQEDSWYALVGLNLNTKAGEHFIVSQGKRYPFTVTNKEYPEQHIQLKTRKHIDLSAEDLARHKGEKKQANNVFKVFDTNQSLDLTFVKPVVGPYSSPFGLQRFFNGEPRSPHSGLDIAAPTGTPILAPTSGKVVLTGDFFFNGNVVYMDHGQGLISMFCHLSDIHVKAGDTVQKGEVIGEVGATGRVTGPHLHWSLSLNNARIDPMLFLPADKKQP